MGVSQREFALKKIRCPTGSDGVKDAMREVEAYRRFKYVNADPHAVCYSYLSVDTRISYEFWYSFILIVTKKLNVTSGLGFGCSTGSRR